MDASSHRFAVAVLLDGRMGLVRDLHLGHDSNGELSAASNSSSVFTGRLYQSRDRINAEERDIPMTSSQIASRSTDEQNPALLSTIDVRDSTEGIKLRDTGSAALLPFHSNSQGIPVETGSCSIYRHLCSDDDPPRSVSICPQRRCAAFGCSAGIELHWVDALMGQDFSPRQATSSISYRHDQELTRPKLRLISIAAHPSDRPSICRRFFSTNCDHHRAVPLSDGYHVLFTDPASSKLFLGSDAPLGGPAKLLRKILLVLRQPDGVPRIYATAADLNWGARIVVAFGDTVVLYSVPPDIFFLSKLEQKAESAESFASSAFGSEARARDWWLNWWRERDLPLQPGTVISTVDGLVELAIYTNPDLTTWALALDGRAVTWQVDSGQRPLVTAERNIGRDSRVNDYERSVGFDGHDSTLLQKIPRALHVDNDENVDSVNISSGEAWYDEDGNIVMFDAEDGRAIQTPPHLATIILAAFAALAEESVDSLSVPRGYRIASNTG
ncbi:uncharacterized protein K441DRAFT_684762 [Cenococcum geophilum 1.58]|uniref:uncharacterized protein n=1 Tax=Cenococcum geophilum 1.58 TaxID=794803 RepID=UPI00358EA1FF|nr:hypothetical protein K441DRAFT_684762 [Cenococcum geophilum 1.58]